MAIASWDDSDRWFGAGPRRVILPASSRRLRHLQAILVRNLRAPEGRLVNSYFTLESVRKSADPDHPEDEEYTLLYKSEVVEHSVNPAYADIASTLLGDVQKANVHETLFRVRIYSVEDARDPREAAAAPGFARQGTSDLSGVNADDVQAAVAKDTLVLERVVDVKQAQYLGSALGEGVAEPLMGEAIVFEFHDGVFVCDHVADPAAAVLEETSKEQLIEDYTICSSTSLAELKKKDVEVTGPQTISDVRYNVTRLVALSYSAQAKQNKVKALKHKIADALEKQKEKRELLYRKEKTTNAIKELKAKIAQTEEALKKKQAQLAKEKKEVERETKAIEEGEAELVARSDHTEVKEVIVALGESSARNEQIIARKRQALVRALHSVFPIEFQPSAKNSEALTICRMYLSKDSTQATDDEAATALGYITHCVQILSRIWDVPLRYPVFPIGSRSSIQERFIDGALKDEHHCLYFTRGQKYVKSLRLLNKNICQLMQFRNQGNISDRESYMLSNLKQLLDENTDYNQDGDSED